MADESSKKLESITVEGEAGGNLVVIEMNGNRQIKSIRIHTDHKLIDISDLEDLLTVAFNRALDKVNKINEEEVMQSSKNLFPNL